MTLLPDITRRLREVLLELGYVRADGEPNAERACRVANHRLYRQIDQAEFVEIVAGTREPTATQAVQIADGLGFDVRKLLYDEIPKKADRPQNLWDEMEQIGII